jgi:hypothetical protein
LSRMSGIFGEAGIEVGGGEKKDTDKSGIGE